MSRRPPSLRARKGEIMDRTLIRDLAEERAINALSYIAHYQEGDDMETLRDVAKTALDEWAKARITGESLPSSALRASASATMAKIRAEGDTTEPVTRPAGK